MERKQYLDVLRALAAIGVVVIHVASNNWYGYIGTPTWCSFTIYTGIARCAVPIFFMISGALFLDVNKKMTFRNMVRHVLRLVAFLLVWAVVYQLANGQRELKEIIRNIIWANTQTHLWFVYAMIGIYLLVPLLKIFVNHASPEIIVYALALFFVFSSVGKVISSIDRLAVLDIWLQKLQPGSLSGYVGYFLLGYYLDQVDLSRKRQRMVYMLGLAGCFITVSLVLWDCMHTNLLRERFWGYCMPWVAASSSALFLYVKNHPPAPTVARILEEISRCSFGIYGIHFLFIMIFWNFGFTTFSFFGGASVPIITVLVLILSYLSSKLLSKIPIVRRIV